MTKLIPEKSDHKITKKQIYLTQRLTAARDRLLDSFIDLDETVLATEFVMKDWTIKDIIGHVVSWGDEFRADITAILQDENPDYGYMIQSDNEYNEWNQRELAKKRDWLWQRIRADLDRDYEESIALIMTLNSRDLSRRGIPPWCPISVLQSVDVTNANTTSVETFIRYHDGHMVIHARTLEKWQKKRAHMRKV